MGATILPDIDLLSPVSIIPGDTEKTVEDGIAICLSGGGYRAMLFHTGVLWRLIELGLLSPGDHTAQLPGGGEKPIGTLKRVSSVSGGSIISAMLGLKWGGFDFSTPATLLANYKTDVVKPIRDLAGVTIASDTLEGAIKVLTDIVTPGSVNAHLVKAYDKHLFKKAKLSQLPSAPRWVINGRKADSLISSSARMVPATIRT